MKEIINRRPHRGRTSTYVQPGWAGFLATVFAAIGLHSFALAQVAAAEGESQPATLTALVYNYTRASAASLERAEREAGRILGGAGLHVAWLNCPVPWNLGSPSVCRSEVEATDIRVRILPLPNRNKYKDSVFGFTVAPAFANVYYESAFRMAKIDNSDSEMVIILGCVIAHEIGHLLLGPNAHSAGGIMQPEWKREQVDLAMRGRMLFTPEQAKTVEAQAKLRLASQAASIAGINPAGRPR